MPANTHYNPQTAPNPAEWLASSEQERIRVVLSFHRANRLKSGSEKSHAAIHVIVENQIAMGLGPTVRAMARLQTQGLDRHEALHAIGSVVAAATFEAMRDPAGTDARTMQVELNAAIEQLDAKTWREKFGE